MSKKKLLEFGLKEADAFQKNFKIIFDRLVRGYRSMMGKDPEGLDLLKVKMEAREKAINTTKVVNQKGLTLDQDKPIIGGGIKSFRNNCINIIHLPNRVCENHPHNFILEILNDTGIKTRIIRKYLPVINNHVNNYLKAMDFFVNFQLDEYLQETIKSRHRDEFSYYSF